MPSCLPQANIPLSVTDVPLNSFDINADQTSEAGIKEAVEELNYAIDVFISNLLDNIVSRKRFRDKDLPSTEVSSVISETDPMKLFLSLLINEPQGAGRGHILEAILHDKVCTLLHGAFFEGEYFYGIDLDKRTMLEDMFRSIRTEEPWRVAQRWRSITIEAAFRQVPESFLDSTTRAIMEGLKKVINIAYFRRSARFRDMVHQLIFVQERNTIHEIVCKAQVLSLGIQRDAITSHMKLVLAPMSQEVPNEFCPFDSDRCKSIWDDMEPREGDFVFGTFKFGLEVVDEHEERKDFILPEVITEALYRHFSQNTI